MCGMCVQTNNPTYWSSWSSVEHIHWKSELVVAQIVISGEGLIDKPRVSRADASSPVEVARTDDVNSLMMKRPQSKLSAQLSEP